MSARMTDEDFAHFSLGGSEQIAEALRARQSEARLAEALRMLTDVTIKLAPYPPEVSEAVVAIIEIARAALDQAGVRDA